MIAHQALWKIAPPTREFWIKRPHEMLDGSPSPRKLMYVSAKIAVAIVSTVLAISNGTICGSTCFCIRRVCEAPSACARLT